MSTVTRTVRIVEYIVFSREPFDAPMLEAAPPVETTVVERPHDASLRQPRKGDIVEYYSQAGRRGEYRVYSIKQDGTRVELRRYNGKKGFWVDSIKCRYLRREW